MRKVYTFFLSSPFDLPPFSLPLHSFSFPSRSIFSFLHSSPLPLSLSLPSLFSLHPPSSLEMDRKEDYKTSTSPWAFTTSTYTSISPLISSSLFVFLFLFFFFSLFLSLSLTHPPPSSQRWTARRTTRHQHHHGHLRPIPRHHFLLSVSLSFFLSLSYFFSSLTHPPPSSPEMDRKEDYKTSTSPWAFTTNT
jgi:hypothetical protein